MLELLAGSVFIVALIVGMVLYIRRIGTPQSLRDEKPLPVSREAAEAELRRIPERVVIGPAPFTTIWQVLAVIVAVSWGAYDYGIELRDWRIVAFAAGFPVLLGLVWLFKRNRKGPRIVITREGFEFSTWKGDRSFGWGEIDGDIHYWPSEDGAIGFNLCAHREDRKRSWLQGADDVNFSGMYAEPMKGIVVQLNRRLSLWRKSSGR
jgi:hypothetical protein